MGLPFRNGDRLLEVEHVPVRIHELAEPLAPFHLLRRKRELDAGVSHPFVLRLDVIRDERDAAGPGSVSPPMKHRWTRVRGRPGPSSTQWPGFSGVPSMLGSGFGSLGPM